jgi:hypothetical protein
MTDQHFQSFALNITFGAIKEHRQDIINAVEVTSTMVRVWIELYSSQIRQHIKETPFQRRGHNHVHITHNVVG